MKGCTLSIVCLLLITNPLRGTDGHQLIGIGATQKSTAGAGVARGLDATWVLLNPAAIHGLERRVDITIEQFAPTRRLQPDGPGYPDLGGHPLANVGADSEDDSVFYIPSMGVILPGEGHTLGFGFYMVNGMGVDYEYSRTTAGMSQIPVADTLTEYGVGKLAVAYALEAENGWVFGGQVSLNVAQFRSNMLTNTFRAPENTGQWDTSLGTGFQIGVVKKMSWGDWGASYISRQWMQDFEKYDDLFFESMDLPPMLQTGIAWDLRKDLTLLIDGKWLGWSTIDQIGAAPEEGGFGWEDQWVFKMGMIWKCSEEITLQAGFSHGNSPITKDDVFANGLFPAITEDHVTFGSAWQVNETLSLQVTFMHAFENTLEESGEGGVYSQAGKGTRISLEEQSYSIQLSKKF